MPLFGRAARESRIESLHAEREVLSERFATLSFDVLPENSASASGSSACRGVPSGMSSRSDPEAEIRQLNSRRVELERALVDHK